MTTLELELQRGQRIERTLRRARRLHVHARRPRPRSRRRARCAPRRRRACGGSSGCASRRCARPTARRSPTPSRAAPRGSRPGRDAIARYWSRSNSIGVRCTSSPSRRTRRDARVELDRADAHRALVARRRPIGAPQQRVHARDELARAERLRHVVVGADREPDEQVGLAVARGEHEHRQRPLALDLLAHLDAVEAGQHEVEHHEVGPEPFAQRRRRRARRRRSRPRSPRCAAGWRSPPRSTPRPRSPRSVRRPREPRGAESAPATVITPPRIRDGRGGVPTGLWRNRADRRRRPSTPTRGRLPRAVA